MDTYTNAADNLLDRTLSTGWHVKKKIEKQEGHTGSFFSVCYLVEKNEEICFLKAFDFATFFSLEPTRSVVDVMEHMISAYKYEKDLSYHCKENYVTKVSFVKEFGEENLIGYSIPIVPYLIFDLAECDVRNRLDLSIDLDYAFRFKSLHDISVGLKQLHRINVSHQDLKPSNILVFKSESKLGDLGRSICKDIVSPYDKLYYTGDNNYAPPEIMYGYYESDWTKRVFATDCYLLGSLITFYFTGISMSALLRKHIPDNYGWEIWRGDYDEVIPYLENGFAKALNEFESNITREPFKRELRTLVEYLCNPIPQKRGHPKNIISNGDNYDLERFITHLDRLRSKAEIIIKTK